MQRRIYDSQGSAWSVDEPDHIVGAWKAHSEWPDYEYLFKDIKHTHYKKCLDFGCGPARNLVKYKDRFERIDGVDISEVLLEKAKIWIQHNHLSLEDFTLYHANGYDIQNVPSEAYDVVMSTICLQHICVHDIRMNLMREFYRVLKSNGVFTAQMGYGTPSPKTVKYHANFYDAQETNRAMDCEVASPNDLKDDLEKIGFTDFKFYILPKVPADLHPESIFFNARKP